MMTNNMSAAVHTLVEIVVVEGDEKKECKDARTRPEDAWIACRCHYTNKKKATAEAMIVRGASADMAYYKGMGLLRIGRGLYCVRWGDVRGLHFWKRLCDTPSEARQRFNLTHLRYANRQAIGLCLYDNYSIILQRARADNDDGLFSSSSLTTTFIVCLWRIQRSVRAFLAARRRQRAMAFALACHRRRLLPPVELVDAILLPLMMTATIIIKPQQPQPAAAAAGGAWSRRD